MISSIEPTIMTSGNSLEVMSPIFDDFYLNKELFQTVFDKYVKEIDVAKIDKIEFSSIKKMSMDSVIDSFRLLPALIRLRFSFCQCDFTDIEKWGEEYGKQITEIELVNSKVTDSTLSSIAENCPSLRKISIICATKVTDSSVCKLAEKCSQLQSIWLLSCRVSDKSLCPLVKNSPNLRELRVEGKEITDQLMKDISKFCPNIQAIGVNECPKVTDEGVAEVLSKCTHLTHILAIDSGVKKHYPSIVETNHMFIYS